MTKSKKINRFKYEYFLLIFFSLIIIITSGRGADFGEYSKWTEYFSSFNFEILSEYPKSAKDGVVALFCIIKYYLIS